MWNCREYCNGCSSVICYDCFPRAERFCQINLESKRILVRDPSDKRYNTIINIKKIGNNYCESYAFKKVKNGACIIK